MVSEKLGIYWYENSDAAPVLLPPCLSSCRETSAKLIAFRREPTAYTFYSFWSFLSPPAPPPPRFAKGGIERGAQLLSCPSASARVLGTNGP